MKIDEGILSKKEKLDFDEWTEIRDHPETGYRILKQTGLFEQIADIVVALFKVDVERSFINKILSLIVFIIHHNKQDKTSDR